jgi:hypothetical protein
VSEGMAVTWFAKATARVVSSLSAPFHGIYGVASYVCRPLGAPPPTPVLTCQQACTSWQGSHTNLPDWLAGTGQQGVPRQGLKRLRGWVWLALVMCRYWWLGVVRCQGYSTWARQSVVSYPLLTHAGHSRECARACGHCSDALISLGGFVGWVRSHLHACSNTPAGVGYITVCVSLCNSVIIDHCIRGPS